MSHLPSSYILNMLQAAYSLTKNDLNGMLSGFCLQLQAPGMVLLHRFQLSCHRDTGQRSQQDRGFGANLSAFESPPATYKPCDSVSPSVEWA